MGDFEAPGLFEKKKMGGVSWKLPETQEMISDDPGQVSKFHLFNNFNNFIRFNNFLKLASNFKHQRPVDSGYGMCNPHSNHPRFHIFVSSNEFRDLEKT